MPRGGLYERVVGGKVISWWGNQRGENTDTGGVEEQERGTEVKVSAIETRRNLSKFSRFQRNTNKLTLFFFTYLFIYLFIFFLLFE